MLTYVTFGYIVLLKSTIDYIARGGEAVGIGENIRSIRILRGLTQENLAEMAKLSRSSIVNFETGKRAPRVDDLESIAKALGVEVSIFFHVNPTNLRKTDSADSIE